MRALHHEQPTKHSPLDGPHPAMQLEQSGHKAHPYIQQGPEDVQEGHTTIGVNIQFSPQECTNIQRAIAGVILEQECTPTRSVACAKDDEIRQWGHK